MSVSSNDHPSPLYRKFELSFTESYFGEYPVGTTHRTCDFLSLSVCLVNVYGFACLISVCPCSMCV